MILLNAEIPAIIKFAHSLQRTRKTSPQAILLRMLEGLDGAGGGGLEFSNQ